MLVAREARKYFSKRNCFTSFQELIEPEGRSYSQSLTKLAKEKGNACCFTFSSKIPYSLMLERTTWNSFKFLWGSSLARPQKVGNKCINPDFNSKVAPKLQYSIHKGCWFKSGATKSFNVMLFMAMTSFSFELLEELEELLKANSKDILMPNDVFEAYSVETCLAFFLNLCTILLISRSNFNSSWWEDLVIKLKTYKTSQTKKQR